MLGAGPMISTENNKKECSTQQRKFLEVLENRESIMESIDQINKTLDALESHKHTLLDVLRIHDNRVSIELDKYASPHNIKACETIKGSPLHIVGERYLLMVYNLGRLPGPNMKSFYSHKCIYPIDYMCKRAYYKYGASVDDMNEILFYNCAIRNSCNKPIFEITEGSHLCIRGKANEVFNSFKSLFPVNIDFVNLQDLFGLSNPEVRRLITEQNGFQELDMGNKCFK